MGLFMAFQYPVSVPGVTVTKYLRTVMNAHRVVVLDEGRVLQVGSHTELMRDGGLYRRLVERQFVSELTRGAPEG